MFPSATNDELVDLLGQMHGIGNASMRLFLAGLVELDQRELWREDAASSVELWLVLRHGVSQATARTWARTARALVLMPTLAATFDAGHLSWDQLLPAIDLVAFGGLDEADVAADAVGRTAAELDRLAREARRVSREESLEREEREYVRTRWDRSGMLRLHGRLSDEHGKVVERALDRLAQDEPRGLGAPRRSYEKRSAEALYTMASATLGADAEPDRATVVVHVDAHALAGGNDAVDLARIELGPLVSMATAHRLACDGRCQVVVDDVLGRTVEVAKTVHAVPRWLRRKVLHRDGGCRWPGCERTALLHVHHIRWWTRDRGPTEERNLAALCWFHHHAVHEGGWEIEGDPFGRLRFIGPHGQVLQVGPPGIRLDVRDALGLRWADDPPVTAA